MHFGELVEARFIARLNRFAAMVEMDGAEVLVHVANSGRMRELLVEGRRMLLRPVSGDHRKTAFDLALVAQVHQAFESGRLPQFAGYDTLAREVTYGESRLDIAIDGPLGRCYIETKSVTLVENGRGLFPDAPTSRGTKHVGSLSRAADEGHRAAVVFVVQREDVRAFAPNYDADPEFGVALRMAVENGVEVYAYRCGATTEGVELADELPVRL